ncbi:MAG: hypothetical protein ACK5Y2_05240 [Bdellovibrionales bacterium]
MATEQLLVVLELALSKSLTVDSIALLKDDGMIKTVKVVSSDYQDMELSERLAVTIRAIKKQSAEILKSYDITFILVSKIEDDSSVDYEALNKSPQPSKEKLAAKDL